MKKRTRLDVSEAQRAYAEQYGAYFDKKDRAWYVDGDVPMELEELVVAQSWHSYTAGPIQVSSLATAGIDGLQNGSATSQKVAGDLLDRVSHLTALLQSLAGGPGPAIRWLETPKIALGRRAPIEAMKDLAGCDQVEKLIHETFS